MPTEDIENGRDGRIAHQTKEVIIDRDPGDEQAGRFNRHRLRKQWMQIQYGQQFINSLASKISSGEYMFKSRQMGFERFQQRVLDRMVFNAIFTTLDKQLRWPIIDRDPGDESLIQHYQSRYPVVIPYSSRNAIDEKLPRRKTPVPLRVYDEVGRLPMNWIPVHPARVPTPLPE